MILAISSFSFCRAWPRRAIASRSLAVAGAPARSGLTFVEPTAGMVHSLVLQGVGDEVDGELAAGVGVVAIAEGVAHLLQVGDHVVLRVDQRQSRLALAVLHLDALQL